MSSTLASRRLLEIALPAGVRVSSSEEAVEFSLHRSSLHVVITVPVGVLEWFVEASDRTSGVRVEDWCDYEGYDSSPASQLDLDMANDVDTFVSRLLARELRLAHRGGNLVALEWKVGEEWEQAVPLTAEPA